MLRMSNHRQHHVEIVESFDPADFQPGTVNKLRLSMVGNGMGGLISIPIVVFRGIEDGPVMGLTAAVHGNELNGVRVVQKVVGHLKPTKLKGTVICVPVVNVPGYLNNTRHFNDGYDLNRVMPGKRGGTPSQVYAHRFMNRVVKHFNYMIDLHTASFGRINTLYVRADLDDPVTAKMALLQRPSIVLHNPPMDHTLRGWMSSRGSPAITVEIGNPHVFQPKQVKRTLQGLRAVLAQVHMLPRRPLAPVPAPVFCDRSRWLYTDRGGLLQVLPELRDMVEEGQVIARQVDVFGDLVREYVAPHRGIVIGKSVEPVSATGARILHLGHLAEPLRFGTIEALLEEQEPKEPKA